ncbi:hypothetical protein EDB19DRAFT_2022570 [Suillus lakei]|nr:hypothetical protein EDB19DRAFT_2022570 [Suillus lakei]
MSDDPMDVDDSDKPNIPRPGAEQEVEFIEDLDDIFQSSSESDDQVSGEGTLPTASYFINWYPKPSKSYGKGYTFLNLFNSDENSMYHAKNPYYPFSGRKDWEIALWLLHSGLSMGKIDSFLSLEMNMQSALPKGTTLLGTILSSNKTNISTMMGDRIAHPLLVGLVNINMSTQLKTMSNSFILTTLLPIPKFIHKNKCIYIVDTPEAMMLATVGGKTSPVTMAMFKQFGDPFHHEPRTKSTILAQLAVVQMRANPSDIQAFFHEAQKFRLNSIFKPFWRDWILSEPSHFFTPEFLHLIHQEFYDHDMKWMICAVGDMEIDFWFSVLQPITGFCQFHGGISKLKQVTGQTQQNIQHSIVAVSAGTAPSAMITAVQVLMEFWYLMQSPHIDDDNIEHISGALAEFHANKHTITAGGFCCGTKNKIQVKETTVVKGSPKGDVSGWRGKGQVESEMSVSRFGGISIVHESHICHHLDWVDKCHRFDLAMSLMDSMACSKLQDEHDGADVDFDANDDHDLPAELIATIKCPGYLHPITNYFTIVKILQHKEVGTVPLPLHTFVVGCMACHLTYAPSIRSISTNNAAIKFDLSDFWPAIADFLHHEATHGQNHIHTIGGARRVGANASLPFQKIQIWFKLRLQDTEFHDSSIIWPVQTLNCVPPSDVWNSGRYDSVIVNNELGYLWPADGLRSHTVGQVRLIMHPVGKSNMDWLWKDRFLVYVYHFDGTASARDPAMQLHLIRRVKCSNVQRALMSAGMPRNQGILLLPPLSYYTLEYTKQMPPQFFFRMGGYRIKLSSLISLPAAVTSHAPIMNKFTAKELNCLVTQEDEPAASQPLGHMLPHIFQSFTTPLPALSMLEIPLKNILHHNEHTKAKFSQNSPDDLVPLYDTDVQLWNWDLPIAAPIKESESTDSQQPEPDSEDNTQTSSTKKATHKEIFSSFFNALAVCLEKAAADPKRLSTSMTHMWTAAHVHKPLPGSEIKQKPDILLSDKITANWGNIRVLAELTHSVYQPVLPLVKVADTHTYLMLSEQPWRHFALVLSLTNEYQELRVLFYDHAGSVISPTFNIYQQADILAHIIAVIRFGSLECISYDLTVSFTKHVSPPHHHTNNYHLIKNLPTRWQLADHTMTAATSEPPNPPHHNFKATLPSTPIESISADLELESESHTGSGYVSMEHLEPPPPPLVQVTAISSAPLLKLASQAPQEPNSIYTATPHPSQFPYSAQSPEPCGKIHDHWVQGKEDQVVLNEIDMLKCMSGIPGVPELVDWWIVERSNGDADVTNQLGGGSQGFLIDWEFAVHINPDLKYDIGGMVHQDHLGNTILDHWNNMDLESCATFKGNFFATIKEEHHLVEEIHPYFKDLIPLAKEWCTTLKDNMENPVSFNNILTLLNSHLNHLLDDEELASTFKMLKESAALLTDCVEKHGASQSFSVGLPKWQSNSTLKTCSTDYYMAVTIMPPHASTSPKKKKRSKHKDSDASDRAGLPKKSCQAANLTKAPSMPLVSLGLVEAEAADRTGGRNSQLEKIGTILESQSGNCPPKGSTSLGSHIPVNPQALEPACKGQKGHSKAAPPPYSSLANGPTSSIDNMGPGLSMQQPGGSMLNIIVTGVNTTKSSIQFLIAVVRNTLDNVTLQSERSRWWNLSQRICQYGHWEEVAQAVFSNDEDLEVQRLFKEDPKAFIKPVSTCFSMLRKKYNKFNKDLKQSGAGKTYAELQEDPKMKSLINTKLEKFPWWPELHGWWRTNPAFNYAFSTADAGQDFASAALEHFNLSKQLLLLATGDDDTHTNNDPEDGEIVEIPPPHRII